MSCSGKERGEEGVPRQEQPRVSPWRKHCLSLGTRAWPQQWVCSAAPCWPHAPGLCSQRLRGAGEQSRPAVDVAWSMTSSGSFLPGPHSSGGVVPARLITPCFPFTLLLIPPICLAPCSGSSGWCSRDLPDLYMGAEARSVPWGWEIASRVFFP